MFFIRLLSGAVLLGAAVLLCFFGNIWLLLITGLLSLIGNYELLRVFRMEKSPLGIVVYLTTIGYYALLHFGWQDWSIAMILPLMLLALLTIYVIRYPKDTIDSVTKALFSFLYVSVLLSFVYQTRCLNQGQWLVWLIIIGSWGSDTCAYCVGMLIGKHHLSELSPKKTIEGCIGGVLGAGIIAYIFAFFFPLHDAYTVIRHPHLVFPIVAVVCAFVSQVGDLAASAIKRNYEMKDYGTVIPGHGGVLDRFDSVIFVAPFVYYLLFLAVFIL